MSFLFNRLGLHRGSTSLGDWHPINNVQQTVEQPVESNTEMKNYKVKSTVNGFFFQFAMKSLK